MNTISTISTLSPYGITEECAQMVIDDLETPFTFRNLMTTGEVYTFSCWAKASVSASIKIADSTISLGTSWSKIELTFTAIATSLNIVFLKAGTYSFYHSQLEFGNMATDWSPSPDDVRDEMQEEVDKVQSELDETKTAVKDAALDIDGVKAMISMLVQDASGSSLMTQTSTGWTFNMGAIMNDIDTSINDVHSRLNSADETIGILKDNVTALGEYEDYIDFTTINGHPAIVLGETNSQFKVQITNEMIEFLEGTGAPPAYISNQSLYIRKAVVTEELQQGGFVWRVESNNSYSLIWKGV